MKNNYEDIIYLPHHVSKKHPQMPVQDRAAQFAPFAALTGYGDVLQETARLTEKKIELDEYDKDALNRRLRFVLEEKSEDSMVFITYFVPDERKDGGAYVTIEGEIRRLDDVGRSLQMMDGTVIPIEDILSIDGTAFDDYE